MNHYQRGYVQTAVTLLLQVNTNGVDFAGLIQDLEENRKQMTEFLRNYAALILGFVVGAATIVAPLLIPKLFDFLLARGLERYKLKLIQIQKAEKITQLFHTCLACAREPS